MKAQLKDMLSQQMAQLNISSIQEIGQRVGPENKEMLMRNLQEQLIQRIQLQMQLKSI